MEKGLKKWWPEYITTGAVAGCCGVSKVTVLRWIEKGHLIAFRLPEGHYRIHRDDFYKFLDQHNIPFHKQTFNEKEN